MIEKLESIDQQLFVFLNGIHAEWMDPIMVFFSAKFTWIPFYLFLLFWLKRKTNWKAFGVYAISIVLLITLADQGSVKLFKNVFERYRPCHHVEIKEVVHLIKNHCGGKYGFVSSHATNVFALAGFLFFSFKQLYQKNYYGLFAWAAVVSYSRIYLGVHYPADILCGALLGLMISVFVRFITIKLHCLCKC